MHTGTITLRPREFEAIRSFIHQHAGISLSPEKRTLVSSRLEKRLRHLNLGSYADYLGLIETREGADERRMAIDLLTTNETYFFREPKHFDFLRDWIGARDRPGRRWRVWCAASSSGEEPYSIAMTLAEALDGPRWEVLASDISSRVLDAARRGIYAMSRLEQFPAALMKRYCLRGTGPQAGNLAIDRRIRDQVEFRQINLNAPLPAIGIFDVVFLRNVLIYFDAQTKRAVIERVIGQLAPEGCLIVSHSENLHGLSPQLVQAGPSVYRKSS